MLDSIIRDGMTKRFILIFLSSILVGCASTKNTMEKDSGLSTDAYQGNLIIFYDKKVGPKHLERAIEEYPAEIIYRYNQLNGFAVRIPSAQSIDAAIRYFKKIQGVRQVSRDKLHHLDEPSRDSQSR